MTLTSLTIRNNIYRAYYSDGTSLIISKSDAEGLAKAYNIRVENDRGTAFNAKGRKVTVSIPPRD